MFRDVSGVLGQKLLPVLVWKCLFDGGHLQPRFLVFGIGLRQVLVHDALK